MLTRADIRTFKIESWRERIGVVFQEPILFAGTVHDNIAYGRPGATRLEVEDAARQANCDFIWDLPQGFDTMSEWGGVASSLGWIVQRMKNMSLTYPQSGRPACPADRSSGYRSRGRW